MPCHCVPSYLATAKRSVPGQFVVLNVLCCAVICLTSASARNSESQRIDASSLIFQLMYATTVLSTLCQGRPYLHTYMYIHIYVKNLNVFYKNFYKGLSFSKLDTRGTFTRASYRAFHLSRRTPQKRFI